jgi:MazG family protein
MQAFDRFVEIIARLRAPDGCPWDREQTHETLIPYCIEEAYEVVDAIREGNLNELKGELGDLILQVVLHAQVAKDNKDFTIEDVLNEISDKMVRRHPHVFSDAKVETAGDVPVFDRRCVPWGFPPGLQGLDLSFRPLP